MLTGKNALVTGASRGIGRAIALELAKRGAFVVVNYNGSEDAANETVAAIKAAGGDAVSVRCNVSDFTACQEMIESLIKEYKHMDILVNNAGITRDDLLMRMKESDFDAVINTNLKGTFNTIRHLSRYLLKQRAGKIINISSVSGILGNAGQSNYAASKAGVDKIYKVGGAQAIASLAFGTASIPKVDKIVGPGNIYVALAKKAVYGQVGIDSIAGPSEIMVLADETANPRYVAADLLSQAEHDELASAILVTTSMELANKVSEEVTKFVNELSRKAIIEKSLENYGYILVAESMEEAISVVNEIASEHLEIVTKDPFQTMTKIRNAGAIFLGEYSSEPLGDYFAGPNHVLPTNGTAKFFSPLEVDDFIKKSSIISYSREALMDIHDDIEAFAKAEGLTAHANSIKVRFE